MAHAMELLKASLTPPRSLSVSHSELTDKIQLLRLRSEQIYIHLNSLAQGSPEAGEARTALTQMLQEINELKGLRRDRI